MGKGQEWWKLAARSREGYIQTYTDRVLRSGASISVETVKKLVHSAMLNDGWFEARMVRNKAHQWHVCEKFYSYKGASGNHRGYHGIIQKKIDDYIVLEQQIREENQKELDEFGGYETVGGVSGGTVPEAKAPETKKSFLPLVLIGGALILIVVFFKRKKSK